MLPLVTQRPNQNEKIPQLSLLFRLLMATVPDLTVEGRIGMIEEDGSSNFKLF